MPRGTLSTDNDFHELLDWISVSGRGDVDDSEGSDKISKGVRPVSEDGGRVYEDIRYRLIKFFQSRGCLNPEELADDAIERVTKKIHKIVETYEGKPLNYFYGVARNIVKEQRRKPEHEELPEQLRSDSGRDSKLAEVRDQCLDHCLARLDSEEKRFILEYYFGEKSEKIENRLRLREEFGLNKQSIGVKAFRIRERLQRCVLACVKGAER